MTPQQSVEALARPLLRQLLRVVRDLTEVMQSETRHLRAREMAAFGDLQAQKSALTTDYEKYSAQLQEQANFLRGLNLPEKVALTEALSVMKQVMVENELAITAAQEANERIAKALTEAVRDHRGAGDLYGATGQTVGVYNSAPVSVQIDRHL